MLKIRDKVYSCRNGFKELKVISINGIYVKCEGYRFKPSKYNHKEGEWEQGVFNLNVFELSEKPYSNNKIYTKSNKWDNIIQRRVNMTTKVLRLYEDVLNEEVNMKPFYQRDIVWTLKQKQEFLQAIFEDRVEITPTIILNWENLDKNQYEVLDGLQRLSTIFDFINNKFPIYDNVYFSELSSKDRCSILDTKISYTRIEKLNKTNLTDNEKIQLFLEMNALGTKMSDEHIEKVKNMLIK